MLNNAIYDYKLPRVLIVDDDPSMIEILGNLLNKNFKRQVATSGSKAINILNNSTDLPDLILLDLVMPEVNGFDVCKKIKSDIRFKDIPIISISSLSDSNSIEKAFEAGCIDYIGKPLKAKEVQARIRNHIDDYHKKIELQKSNQELNYLIDQKTKEIIDSQMATIFALAKLTESRDDDTGKHIERVQAVTGLMLKKMSQNEKYRHIIDKDYIELVQNASVLHDIGKIGIEDTILLKPGKLTQKELSKMKQHTIIGSETLKKVYNKYPENKFIMYGIEISRFHHEKWDGSGYPDGLYGENIPLSARVVAIADVYDALRSKRVYKNSFLRSQSCDMIADLSGSHFDPLIVEIFLNNENEINSIYL